MECGMQGAERGVQGLGRKLVRVVAEDSDWSRRLSPQTMMVVSQGDAEPYFTGILDANGEPMYRFPEKVPMGFQGPQRMTEEEYAAWRFEQDGCHE
jgi:hypothetical protein